MDDERRDDSASNCADCGASSLARSFPLGNDSILCWDCAVRRGGQFDAELDEWTTSPDIADLRRAWSPRGS